MPSRKQSPAMICQTCSNNQLYLYSFLNIILTFIQ